MNSMQTGGKSGAALQSHGIGGKAVVRWVQTS